MLKWLTIAGVVVVADQLTKYVVVTNLYLGERVQVFPFFAWVRWENDGAAFSLFSGFGGRWFFVALAIGFAAFIIYELRRLPPEEKIMGWVFGLILGGALGNGIDRLLTGFVVDFVLVHYDEYIFPAFNVADSALFCGAATWIVVMFIEWRQSRANDGGANA